MRNGTVIIRYISYRHDLYSNADKHNPSSRVNRSITQHNQTWPIARKKYQILFHSPFSSFLLFSSSCSERSLHEKTVAFQIQNIEALLGLCVRSVFVESALPGPRCPWFPGHSFIRSRGMAGVAGDVAAGSRGSARTAVTVNECSIQPFLPQLFFLGQ